MSLFTDVTINGERIIVLNINYSKEQLFEKLTVPGGYSEETVKGILKEGRYIEKPISIVCQEEESVIMTQMHQVFWYIHWGEKLTIYPDGRFEKKERGWFKELLWKFIRM